MEHGMCSRRTQVVITPVYDGTIVGIYIYIYMYGVWQGYY